MNKISGIVLGHIFLFNKIINFMLFGKIVSINLMVLGY